MSDSLDLSMEGVERRSLSSFTEEAYLCLLYTSDAADE